VRPDAVRGTHLSHRADRLFELGIRSENPALTPAGSGDFDGALVDVEPRGPRPVATVEIAAADSRVFMDSTAVSGLTEMMRRTAAAGISVVLFTNGVFSSLLLEKILPHVPNFVVNYNDPSLYTAGRRDSSTPTSAASRLHRPGSPFPKTFPAAAATTAVCWPEPKDTECVPSVTASRGRACPDATTMSERTTPAG